MLHHLAIATIQVANLVNYNCHPQEDGNNIDSKSDFFFKIVIISLHVSIIETVLLSTHIICLG